MPSLARLNGNRDHDVAKPLARGLAHDAAHGLDHIDLAVARLHEDHGIQRGYVHAFGEQPDIADHLCPAFHACVRQFAQGGIPFQGAVGGIQMAYFQGQGRARVAILLPLADGGGALDQRLVQGLGIEPGTLDAVGETQGTQQTGGFLQIIALGNPVDGKGSTEHAHHVAGLDYEISSLAALLNLLFLAQGNQLLPQTGRHRGVADSQHDHPVVREHVVLHGTGKGETVQLRAVGNAAGHVHDRVPLLTATGLGCRRVDARGGGHVEPPVAGQQVGVVHALEGGEVVFRKETVVGGPCTVDAGGAVRLVRDGQIEGRCAVPPLCQ